MQTDNRSRYSDQELEEFRLLIEEKLGRAREQLAYYKAEMANMADSPDAKIRGLDDGTGTLESEEIYTMAARQQKLIQHLENALIRIRNKAYGICRETGQLISKDRLRAVPHATLSIHAKKQR
jgi:RNA polymerase-binding transcription factor DksA